MNQKEKIISKINRSKKGTIFLPDSFLPIDTHYASNILSELCKEGVLVRVAFGIYTKPVMSPLGPIMPSMYEVAKTIADRDSSKLLPTGATAENYLGFSTQVPMNAVYLTSGTSRRLRIRKRTLTLKHSVPKTFAYKGEIVPVLVLALKSIGRHNVSDDTLDVVYGILKKHPEDETWQYDMKLTPRWIRKVITDIKDKISHNEQMD